MKTQGDTSSAFDTQVDTLILDHRKELNAIIGESAIGWTDSRFHPSGLRAKGRRCLV